MMKDIVQQALNIYIKKLRAADISELQNVPSEFFTQKGCCFVTIFSAGEVHGSAGNIKEISENLVLELIANTVSALKDDTRFPPLTKDESENLQFRVDLISSRTLIDFSAVKKLDPTKDGVICIARNYENLAVILPNVSPKLLTGDDFIPVLEKKLNQKKINDKNYIYYSSQTQVETNY